jgi:uncharacterized protein YlzI (FlbEa/FlbD family)
LDEKKWTLEWAHVIEDLDALQETTITIDDRAFVVRSEAKRTVGKVFQACHVALPPVLRSPRNLRRRQKQGVIRRSPSPREMGHRGMCRSSTGPSRASRTPRSTGS